MLNLQLQNGETVELTLNFKHLYTLRAQRPEAYKNYYRAVNEIGGKGERDQIWPCVQTIYTAYLCGAIQGDKLAETMNFTDFLEQLPENTATIVSLGNALLFPNPRGGSGSRSRQKSESDTAEE